MGIYLCISLYYFVFFFIIDIVAVSTVDWSSDGDGWGILALIVSTWYWYKIVGIFCNMMPLISTLSCILAYLILLALPLALLYLYC